MADFAYAFNNSAIGNVMGNGMSGCDQSTVESLAEDPTDSPFAADECLKVRKYWCFLLSSIFTFLAGLFIVLLWRAFAFICCRKEPDLGPNDPKQKEQKASRNKQEFEGTFMTEAKDWAGELISGQTTTGRILHWWIDTGGNGRKTPLVHKPHQTDIRHGHEWVF
ncbi:unnamed protein product [Ceratitis capitata]|uniref:(Mediterranean fruit fly) hypothetical protein n=1 Tax=Ceratitis capitata TaxID=7213 RepID=A0A811U8N7_CERCA|nr:unnamed protein product [Ceratitis capitata]